MNNETGLIKLPKRKKSDCRKSYRYLTIFPGEWYYIQTKLTNPKIIRENTSFYPETNPFRIEGQDHLGRNFIVFLSELRKKDYKSLEQAPKPIKNIWIKGIFKLDSNIYSNPMIADFKKLYLDDKPICPEKKRSWE